jgi:hypothetical protein
MQQYQDLELNPFKIRHCTTCFGLLGHHQARCVFRATAIGVFVFTVFLNEVNVVPPSMPHVLSFRYACCLSKLQDG